MCEAVPDLHSDGSLSVHKCMSFGNGIVWCLLVFSFCLFLCLCSVFLTACSSRVLPCVSCFLAGGSSLSTADASVAALVTVTPCLVRGEGKTKQHIRALGGCASRGCVGIFLYCKLRSWTWVSVRLDRCTTRTCTSPVLAGSA